MAAARERRHPRAASAKAPAVAATETAASTATSGIGAADEIWLDITVPAGLADTWGENGLSLPAALTAATMK